MSIEVNSPHIVNSLVADAHRQQRIRAFPKPAAKTTAVESGICRAIPVIPSHQTTAAAKITTSADTACRHTTEDIEKDCYKQLLCNERLYRELTLTENTFVKSLDELLDRSKDKHKSKYKVLFTKWEESIYNKLRDDIHSKLGSHQYDRLDGQKRKLFSRYLATCNSKGTVFLDVISKREYDPLGLAHRGLSTTIPTRADPTKLVENEEHESECIEEQCGLKCSSTRTRHPDTRGSCNDWIRLPIKDVDSHVRQRSRQRMMDKTVCSVQVLENELNLQKKKPALPSYSLHRPLSQMFY